MNAVTNTVACANHAVHNAGVPTRERRQHHHHSVAEVRNCFKYGGSISIEEENDLYRDLVEARYTEEEVEAIKVESAELARNVGLVNPWAKPAEERRKGKTYLEWVEHFRAAGEDYADAYAYADNAWG